MTNSSHFSAAIKIIDIDLASVMQQIVEGAKLPIIREVSAPRSGGVCEDIIEALAQRAIQIDRQSLYADNTLTLFKSGEQKIELGDSVEKYQVFLVLDFPSLDETKVSPEIYAITTTTLLNNYLHLAKQVAEAARYGGGAAEVHLIMPNHADARQDQRHGARGPITVGIVAKEFAPYFDSITSVHLHAPQTEALYSVLGRQLRHISPNEIHGPSFICRDPDTLKPIPPRGLTLDGIVRLFNRVCIASPDVGGAKVARNFIKSSRQLAAAIICENATGYNSTPGSNPAIALGGGIQQEKFAASALTGNPEVYDFKRILKAIPDIPLVVVDKTRPSANVAEIVNVLGIEHARGRDCTLFDDMGDGLGTLVNAGEALLDSGAPSVEARITHGYFSDGALELLSKSRIGQIVVGNGMALRPAVLHDPKVRVINEAAALAQVIVDIVTSPTPNIIFGERHTHDQDFRRHSGRFVGPMLDSLNS